MKKRPSIAMLTALLAVVFAAGIGVYSSYIGMKIYQESSNNLFESFSQISKTFTLFVQRNWTVLGQWDGLLKNTGSDADAENIWPDVQGSKESWRYSDFYLLNEDSQYLTADGRKGSAGSISGVIQELYNEDGPIVSTYTASYGVPKIVFAMPLSRDVTLDGVTYTGLAVSYDTDVVDDLVDGSMYSGQSDCYIVRTNGDIVLSLEPQTELCKGLTNLYDIDAHAEWKYGTMDDIRDCIQLGKSGSAQFTCERARNYLIAIPTDFPDWALVGIIHADEVDGAMRSVQQSTSFALGALGIFAIIIVVLALSMESQLRLRREEEARLSLEREKMQSDRLLQSMSRIVDRYSIVNLDTNRYRYRELRLSKPLYPTSGQYSEMVKTISEHYVALNETENAKLSRLLTPEYLRSVLRKPNDNLKIEYCSRTENAYLVLTILPVAWHADGTVYEVMQIVQDIGQKVELETMANTDSLTGLFNVLIAAMALLLAAGLHQHEPDEALAALSTGWYQLTDGVRRDVTLPATLPAEPGQTLTLYNDTLTDSDGGKVLSARGVEYDIEIRAGETLLYRYEDNAFPKNAQMKGRLWADAELPDNIGGQTLRLTLTPLSGRTVALAAPVLGTAPAVTGHHIQSSLFSIGMMLAMLVLAVLALLIFFYMSFFGIRELRFLDVAVFLLLCSLWCLTDSALYQIYGRDGAAGSVISFYAFMTMPVPMVHFVRNTVSGRLRLVPDVCIALFCANALAQGAAYRLLGVPFIAMLPMTHLLLTAGVAAMLTALFRSYRDKPAPQLRLRIEAFAALGAFGVAALVLYWLLHIYWYDAVYQFGVLLFIILLLYGLISQAAEDMRFHMEHRISHQMQREDRMTGLPNRRAFEEYMERIRTGRAGCRDAVLTYIRLEGLNERNDRFGLQAGDESVIAAAQCVADFCRACEEAGESVLCFRTGGNEFALIRPEPHTDSGQLHRQFRAVVARYNRTCAPRARITMTFGFSRLCDEDGKSRSISAWKAEADAHLKRNEAGLGGDAE